MIGIDINGYIIQEFIGKGEFGSVYRCRKSGNEFAIKIFNLEYVYSEYKTNPLHNRITQEIEALKRVNHENIVKIFEHGFCNIAGQDFVYVIMEFIEGNNLDDLIEKAYFTDLDQILELFKQILEGIRAIHASNIIHRDLKPANIRLTKDNKIKIVDFGLVKLIDFSTITLTGDRIGSPLYMSPEQIRDSKNIDYRSDYYALGVILFNLLTREIPYGYIESREELYYKILNERPLSVLQFDPSIPNCIDNLINQLLNKTNYSRPNNIDQILDFIKQSHEPATTIERKEFTPSFFLRLWNEKKVLSDFYNDGFTIDNAIFPINHQALQKGLLAHIQTNDISFIIDPASMRLAYETYTDVKGLTSLPYAPHDFSRLELSDLESLNDKQTYLNLVVKEQLKHSPSFIVSPFHVSNNSNIVSIKTGLDENWFTLDIKLLKECKDYLVKNDVDLPLVGGFCIKTDILTSKTEQEYFLNTLSSLPCDYYWVYVDCIDYKSNSSQIYHYIKTLITLQNITNKPVIAGRVGSIGLLLLSFGLYAFESGTARFETFYEDLYKEAGEIYNMYVMYYIPELLKSIPVQRKDPSKIVDLLKTKIGQDLKCQCPYCSGKSPDEIIVEQNTKKHFLFHRMNELNELRLLSIQERLDLITKKIDNAIYYYSNLEPIFKPDDYAFLTVWQSLIPHLRKELHQ